jgi:hypothetical protein
MSNMQPIFGNLAAYSASISTDRSFWGVWQATVVSVNDDGTYDCVIIRNNTVLSRLSQVSPPQLVVSGTATVAGSLVINGTEQAVESGTLQISGTLDSLIKYKNGDFVLVAFRDGRREWPILIGGVV